MGAQGMKTAPDWSVVEDVLVRHEASLRVSRLLEVSSEPAVGAGENFASDISRATAVAVLADGRRRKVSLIAKRMPHSEAQIGFLHEHSFFGTEILMYGELLPMMEEVLRGQGVPPLWPDYLGQRGHFLFFEDLKSKNYRTRSRLERLDLEHGMLGMRALGLFHGAGLVLRELGKVDGLLARLEPTFMVRETSAVRMMQEGGLRAAATAILRDWGPEWKEIGERLLKKSRTVSAELGRLGRVDESPLNVISHGDLWTTNVMFKYSALVDRPIGVRFVDFQLSHYNSYGFDLIYFMNTSLPPALRRSKQDQLLTGYRDALAGCLRSRGLEHLLPSLQKIKAELMRLDLYRLVILLSITPMLITKVEGPLNFDNLVSQDKDLIAQHPEVYSGPFYEEVDQELIRMAATGLF